MGDTNTPPCKHHMVYLGYGKGYACPKCGKKL